MTHQSTFGKLRLLFVVLGTLCAPSLYAQDHSIVPQYGNYSFSYNQVPEPLVSLGPTPSGYAFFAHNILSPQPGFKTLSNSIAPYFKFSPSFPKTSIRFSLYD